MSGGLAYRCVSCLLAPERCLCCRKRHISYKFAFSARSVWNDGANIVGGGIATVRMKFLMQIREIVRLHI